MRDGGCPQPRAVERSAHLPTCTHIIELATLAEPGSGPRHDVGLLRVAMIVEKRKIIEALRTRGQDARADWVDRQLPDEVDSVLNSGIFVTLHLDPAELMASAPNPTEP